MLEFKNISKSFSGVKVLHDISFKVPAGKVTALMGENGAGKSTLMKILSGVITDYDGTIQLQQKEVKFKNILDAEESGIVMIHQELNLVSNLSIGENIFLGKEPINKLGFINFKQIHQQASGLLKDFEFPYSSQTQTQRIGMGWQQLVEIVRAMNNKSSIIIMDEPTSSLTENEKEILFRKIKQLKEQGKTFIYISHRMSEIFEIADNVVIMRDGRFVDQCDISRITRNEIIESMIGKKLADESFTPKVTNAKPVLKLNNVQVFHRKQKMLSDLSFVVNKGDVVGVAGLLGAGRTSLLKFLGGALSNIQFTGDISFEQQPYKPTTVQYAHQRKIVYLSEDRKTEGIFPLLNIKVNASASILGKISAGGFINKAQEQSSTQKQLKDLNTKYASTYQLISRLSGGNQQKVLLSRLLLLSPELILLDEPTRGIDVGAKEEIYKLIQQLSSQGISFIISSSEIPELNKLCNKILVLSVGHQTAFTETTETNSTEILQNAFAKV